MRARATSVVTLYIIKKHTTVDRTHLNEELAHHSDLYLTRHNTHKRQTSKSRRDYPLCTFKSSALMQFIPLQHTTQRSLTPAGFEPAIPASDQPLTLILDRSAIRIGKIKVILDTFKARRICNEIIL